MVKEENDSESKRSWDAAESLFLLHEKFVVSQIYNLKFVCCKIGSKRKNFLSKPVTAPVATW